MQEPSDSGPAKATRIINLTPHAVTVSGPRGSLVLPSEGAARVADRATPSGGIGVVDVVEVSFGEVQGLPEPREGVVLLVSRVLALARPSRSDLVFPFGEIRDDNGAIVAVSALARIQGSARPGDAPSREGGVP